MNELLHPDALANVRWMLGTLLIVLGAVVASNIVDFVSALITARQLRIPVQSAKMRHALDKLVKYVLAIVLAFTADIVIAMLEITHVAYCVIVAGLWMCVVEGWSIWEHYKRRRDKIAKVPETLHELVAWIGDDRAKAILTEVLKGTVKKITDIEITTEEKE